MEVGATKIQAVFRGKQARKGVNGEEGEQAEEAPAEEAQPDDPDLDIPEDEDTANAAVRIQAKYRQWVRVPTAAYEHVVAMIITEYVYIINMRLPFSLPVEMLMFMC